MAARARAIGPESATPALVPALIAVFVASCRAGCTAAAKQGRCSIRPASRRRQAREATAPARYRPCRPPRPLPPPRQRSAPRAVLSPWPRRRTLSRRSIEEISLTGREYAPSFGAMLCITSWPLDQNRRAVGARAASRSNRRGLPRERAAAVLPTFDPYPDFHVDQ